MIVQNSGRSFELCRCMNQELTFHTLQTEMQRRSIEIGSSQMRTLKLTGEDGLYTNLALLLSDQCETTTKVAVFQGTDKELFRDRKEFTGSLLKQLEDVYQFLDLVNKTKATFSLFTADSAGRIQRIALFPLAHSDQLKMAKCFRRHKSHAVIRMAYGAEPLFRPAA